MVKCQCGRRGKYVNKTGEKGLMYCDRCKKPGMSNIYMKKCQHSKCTFFPAFGYPGKKPTRCKTHMMKGMTNLVASKCIKCSKYASFNYPGLKSRIYCSAHALSGMVLMTRKKELKQPDTLGEKMDPYIDHILEYGYL